MYVRMDVHGVDACICMDGCIRMKAFMCVCNACEKERTEEETATARSQRCKAASSADLLGFKPLSDELVGVHFHLEILEPRVHPLRRRWRRRRRLGDNFLQSVVW